MLWVYLILRYVLPEHQYKPEALLPSFLILRQSEISLSIYWQRKPVLERLREAGGWWQRPDARAGASTLPGLRNELSGHSLVIRGLGCNNFTAGSWVRFMVGELRCWKLHGTAPAKKNSETRQSNNCPKLFFCFLGVPSFLASVSSSTCITPPFLPLLFFFFNLCFFLLFSALSTLPSFPPFQSLISVFVTRPEPSHLFIWKLELRKEVKISPHIKTKTGHFIFPFMVKRWSFLSSPSQNPFRCL